MTDAGPATLKAKADVASNRENIPGRGWGVGMVPEHTRWEKPPGKSHAQSSDSLPPLKKGSPGGGAQHGLTLARPATWFRGHVFRGKDSGGETAAPLPSVQQPEQCPSEGSGSVVSIPEHTLEELLLTAQIRHQLLTDAARPATPSSSLSHQPHFLPLPLRQPSLVGPLAPGAG